MADTFLHTMLTPQVQETQRRYYGRTYGVAGDAPLPDELTHGEREFIASRNSFYISCITEDGWPYVQHRGGIRGFLRVTGPGQLMFADYGGNRQLITAGSLAVNDRVCLFLMDYAARERLKLLGHADVFDAREHPQLVDQSAPPGGHTARVERVMVIRLVGYDWNCSKFIPTLVAPDELGPVVNPLKARIAELEAQLDATRSS
jgi:predicted pyridoxine 5'-phosphate oxidase superfamily flavin-nucleotide-binding protein